MKQITVKNADGVLMGIVKMEDPTAWIAECVAADVWGKKERLIPQDEPHELADVLEEVDVVVSPEIPAVMNEAGEVEQEAIPAVVKKHVKLRAEYSVEIVDVSAEHALHECHRKRQMEYPSLGEFADAFVKMQSGDPSQMEAYVAACLAVKAKHPKP